MYRHLPSSNVSWRNRPQTFRSNFTPFSDDTYFVVNSDQERLITLDAVAKETHEHNPSMTLESTCHYSVSEED